MDNKGGSEESLVQLRACGTDILTGVPHLKVQYLGNWWEDQPQPKLGGNPSS